jgi:hypothetical protein
MSRLDLGLIRLQRVSFVRSFVETKELNELSALFALENAFGRMRERQHGRRLFLPLPTISGRAKSLGSKTDITFGRIHTEKKKYASK